jgi:hypothetical protein
MRKMGLPDGPIRQKMLANGETAADVAAFFGETVLARPGTSPPTPVTRTSGAGSSAKGALLASIRSASTRDLNSDVHTNVNTKQAATLDTASLQSAATPKSALFAEIRNAKLKKAARQQQPADAPALTPQQMLMASIKGGLKPKNGPRKSIGQTVADRVSGLFIDSIYSLD